MENNVGAGAEGGLNLPAVYLALLRGINVGGKNRVPMAQLEGIFRAAGCTDVTTYIQSDHVIFRNEDRLVSRVPEFVSAEIADSLGLQVPVLLRTGIEGRHIRLTVESAGRGSSRGGLRMSEGPVLRTSRLVLEPFHGKHMDRLLSLFRAPEVRRFLLDDQMVDREWMMSEVATSEALFETHGCGLWAPRTNVDEGTGDEGIIGAVGYRFFHQPPELQLVVALLPSWWGRGLATEASREAIRYGFEEVGFERIAADADPGNEESLRLMERLGVLIR